MFAHVTIWYGPAVVRMDRSGILNVEILCYLSPNLEVLIIMYVLTLQNVAGIRETH